jgi:hypothetical protein
MQTILAAALAASLEWLAGFCRRHPWLVLAYVVLVVFAGPIAKALAAYAAAKKVLDWIYNQVKAIQTATSKSWGWNLVFVAALFIVPGAGAVWLLGKAYYQAAVDNAISLNVDLPSPSSSSGGTESSNTTAWNPDAGLPT